MQLPDALLQSLRGIPGFNEPDFVAIHNSDESVTSIRLNPLKLRDAAPVVERQGLHAHAIPWTGCGYYLSERPSFTFDPLFHAGCYYVQEASSMFIEQALKQTVDLSGSLKVLDLCAAPGGKSTHLQSLISDSSLLVANEVIRQRVNILKDNIVKWGCHNVVVTNNDPRDFAKLKGYFDVIVVDAPCSGSGLFRRDEGAIDEWSVNNVALCCQRQQRILADVMPALKEGGILIYSTCSYSREEDEDMLDWLASGFGLTNIRLHAAQEWNVTETASSSNNYGYRFWPYLAKGEGFFVAAFRKEQQIDSKIKTRLRTKPVTKQFYAAFADWAQLDAFELIQVNEKIYAWPRLLFTDFDLLLQHLRIIYSGTLLGEPVHKKIIPDHALALSVILSDTIARTDLSLNKAVTYLQKNNLDIEAAKPGWQLAAYKNYPLGWMNVLANRINNYYPKELRILKQIS